MDYSDKTVHCPKCQRNILEPNFVIHEARCKGLSASRVSIRPPSPPSQDVEQFYDCRPQVPFREVAPPPPIVPERFPVNGPHSNPFSRQKQSGRHNSIFGSELGRMSSSKRERKEQERIPCSLCGYNMTLLELDTHERDCQGKQKICQYCGKEFLAVLLKDHEKICPCKSQLRRLQQQIEQEGSDDEDINEQNVSRYRRMPQPPANIRMENAFGFPGMIQIFGGGMRSFDEMIRRIISSHRLSEEEGLSRGQMNNLKRVKFVPRAQEVLCTICYCALEEGEKVIELRCTHMYHDECLSKWLQQHPKCPICKQQAQ